MGQIEKITNAALALAAKRANAMSSDQVFTPADVAQAVLRDPSGDTAFYVAQLIAWGIEWFQTFQKEPDLLEAFGAGK